MYRLLRITFLHLFEVGRRDGFVSALKNKIYNYKEVVPVEKCLFELKPQKIEFEDLMIVEIGDNSFYNKEYKYPSIVRKERALRFLGKGFKSFALVREKSHIVGDVWFVANDNGNKKLNHPHLKWFDLRLGEKDVYMFDMYLTPEERGNAKATFLMNSALHKLKDKGFEKAYGYFVTTNIPALWVHRLLGYRELPRLIVRKIFFYDVISRKS